MQVNPENITVTMTPREAWILSSIFDHLFEDDPYGETSKHLGIDVGEVVDVARSLEDPLKALQHLNRKT